jgi:hypothetical protein
MASNTYIIYEYIFLNSTTASCNNTDPYYDHQFNCLDYIHNVAVDDVIIKSKHVALDVSLVLKTI